MNDIYTIKLDDTTFNHDDRFVIKTYHHDDIATHNHNFFELVYITGGSSLHTLNGIKSSLGPGDYFVIDYGSEHSYENSKNLTLINCLFYPEIIDDTLKGCCSFDELLHVCLLRYYKLYVGKSSANHIFQDQNGRIMQILTGMMQEYEEKKVGYAEIFQNRLHEILILIMRNIINDDLKFKNDAIVKIIEFINQNYRTQSILSTFCNLNHYSPQYISRKFQQETGFTFLEFLQKVRIEKSCELLAGSNLSITEIAESVGYSDVKFFTSLFKRLIKMTPRDYRKFN